MFVWADMYQSFHTSPIFFFFIRSPWYLSVVTLATCYTCIHPERIIFFSYSALQLNMKCSLHGLPMEISPGPEDLSDNTLSIIPVSAFPSKCQVILKLTLEMLDWTKKKKKRKIIAVLQQSIGAVCCARRQEGWWKEEVQDKWEIQDHQAELSGPKWWLMTKVMTHTVQHLTFILYPPLNPEVGPSDIMGTVWPCQVKHCRNYTQIRLLIPRRAMYLQLARSTYTTLRDCEKESSKPGPETTCTAWFSHPGLYYYS